MADSSESNRWRTPAAAGRWNATALLVALVGAGGSLWLSLGMGLKACPLCFYQRAFVLAVAGVLLTALLTSARWSALPAVLSLPASAGGLGVAAFHVWLELSGKLECPGGILGFGSAPQQSLVVFVVLTGLLCIAAVGGRRAGEFGGLAWAVAVALGAFFAAGSIASAPPLPDAPPKPYSDELTTCRPPYRPA
ncbi:MAG TPA: disulfide bond formation protein B [Planctomycetaceae bacterium]|nr:disulfide bond formation protein B [Planctomycetaceae bacterium]